jgi:hypothetical protein
VLNQKNRLMARASSGVAPEMLFPSAIFYFLLHNVAIRAFPRGRDCRLQPGSQPATTTKAVAARQ